MWFSSFFLSTEGVLISIFFFFLITYHLKNRNPRNFPPGPFALPFIGNFQIVDKKHPHIYFTKLAEVYGNVFSFCFGSNKMVMISGYKMVKEALVTQADNFVDRPYRALADRFYSGPTEGLFMSNGGKWKAQRRFALSALRDFGLGKKRMEQCICEEIRYLQEEIEQEKGKLFSAAGLFNNAVSNIVCQLVMGKRYDYSDHNFQLMLKYQSESLQLEGSIWGQLYESFPGVMKRLPGPHNKMFSYFDIVKDFIAQEIKSHKEDLDPNNPRDYIDAFLIKMENLNESDLGFTETNLVLCSADLFLAGTETSATTLLWALVFLIRHPDVQGGWLISPYMEQNRILVLIGGTCVLPVLTSVLFDKTEWETPDTFNPGHFLDADGKFVKREAFLPFSAGKRVCLGESLAKMELFLFFVGLLQKFTFSVPDGVELSTEGVSGIVRVPEPFKVHAKAR
uniref:Cytochrome P450, family 2, subfamily N, polypeptide 13 n=1 Tax=Pundamilia nyererei TaxID=303518 RepID=A0A3B4FEZ8_9CICH